MNDLHQFLDRMANNILIYLPKEDSKPWSKIAGFPATIMLRDWHRYAVAITGPTGSGKSTVTALFKKLGAFVLEADLLAREVLIPPSAALERIRDVFGPQIFGPGGELNRRALGAIVFSDPAKRQVLESIIHPAIHQLAQQKFDKEGGARYPLAVYDCPLLFEKDLDKTGFKKHILVVADEAACIERAVKRDSATAEDIRAKLRSQLAIEEKKTRADIIIENNGTLEELEEKVRRIYNELTG